MARKRARLLLLSAAAIVSTGAGARVTYDLSTQLRAVVSKTDSADGERSWLEGRLSGTAAVRTNRISANVAASGSRRESISGRLSSATVVRGRATAAARVVDNLLDVQAGATAQQRDGRLGVGFGGFSDLDSRDSVQIYSLFVEPRLRRQIGRALTVDASYNAGLTFTDRPEREENVFGVRGRSDSFSQRARAAFTYRPGGGRLGLGTEASWTREDFDRFDQQFRAYRFGGFAVYQLTRAVSGQLNTGYEELDNTQAAVLFDPVTGLPVIDEDGDIVVDSDARRIAFSREGIYATAGINAQFSRRLKANLTAGWRDQGEYVSGRFTYRPGNFLSFSGSVDRSITSLNRNLTQQRPFFAVPDPGAGLVGDDGSEDLADGQNEAPELPEIDPNCPLGFNPQLGECIYDDPLGAVNGTFRQSRAQLATQWSRERLRLGTSVYYTERAFLDPQQFQEPGEPDFGSFSDRKTTTFGVAFQGGMTLRDNQSIGIGITASQSDGVGNFGSIGRVSGQASYRKVFAERLFVSAAATAAYRTDENRSRSGAAAYGASVGLGYTF